MTWFKVDDKLHGHPKWRRASPDAKALWATAGSWSSSYKTDGVIMAADLTGIAADVGISIGRCRKAAAELVEPCELWRPLEDGRPGWRFHNWAAFNPTRAQQDASAAIERGRKAVHRDPVLKAATRLRDGDRCRYCDTEVSFVARNTPYAGQYDHVVPLSQGGQTRLANVVVACRYCNGRKQGKTPDEAGLTLLRPWPEREAEAERGLDPGLDRESGRVGTGRDLTGRGGSGRP